MLTRYLLNDQRRRSRAGQARLREPAGNEDNYLPGATAGIFHGPRYTRIPWSASILTTPGSRVPLSGRLGADHQPDRVAVLLGQPADAVVDVLQRHKA